MINEQVKNFNPKAILVTGGCGFIGSNFIDYLLSIEPTPLIVNLDNLTYAGNLDNLSNNIENEKHVFIKGDICDYEKISKIITDYSIDSIVNFAAESHVDRSITNSSIFYETNVGGTLNLLSASLNLGIKRFLQVSTDEVYGSLGDSGFFTEKSNIKPNSPYSASKASADHFVTSYNKTHGLDTIITRCSNNYGPYQFPEKFIPLLINNAINDKPLPIYGSGENIRDWIYVKDHCEGIFLALCYGNTGEVYNFGGNSEMRNIDLAKKILVLLDKPESLLSYVEDRQGHDYRYAIDISKVKTELNWLPSVNFEEGIESTIKWYTINKPWLLSVTSGEYLNYYEQQYGR